jgi:hypothetical protein
MSSSARRSAAPLLVSAKICRALLDWADEDICPYVFRHGGCTSEGARAYMNLSVLHSDSFFKSHLFVSKGHRDEASATGFSSRRSFRIFVLPNNL